MVFSEININSEAHSEPCQTSGFFAKIVNGFQIFEEKYFSRYFLLTDELFSTLKHSRQARTKQLLLKISQEHSTEPLTSGHRFPCL